MSARSHSESAADDGHGSGIHLPPPSWKPIIVAVGLAMALAGVVINWVVVAVGVVVSVAAIVGWVRDARREFGSLR